MNRNHKSEDEMGQDQMSEDLQLESALRNFRHSVHGWSEQEFSRQQVVRRASTRRGNWFSRLSSPVAAWATASVLLVAAVTVPVGMHHQHALAAAQQAAARDQQRVTAEASALQVAYQIDDEELLRNVDSDVARDTPDAMEPLASLMSPSK